MIGSGIPISQSKAPFPKDITSLHLITGEETLPGSVGSAEIVAETLRLQNRRPGRDPAFQIGMRLRRILQRIGVVDRDM